MKQIPGAKDYFITEAGEVFSYNGVGRKPARRKVPIKLNAVLASGYKNISIKRNGKNSRFMVHTLLLETFVGPCPEGCECRHLDGDRTNNALDNLKWGTYQENQLDRERHGTTNRGERQGRSKLTEEDVHEIRRMARSGRVSRGDRGSGYAEIAKRFNVSRANIAQIMRKKSWFWLEEKV